METDQAITISGVLIKQLNQDNYDNWFKLIKCIFMKKKLTDLLQKASNELDKEGDAMTCILNTLSNDDQRMVNGCEDTVSMITMIKSKYQDKLDEYSLTDELTNLKWTRTMSADEYISKLNVIRQKFKQLDSKCTDDRFIQKLIYDMPSCLTSLKTNYDYQIRDKGDKIEFTKICSTVSRSYARYMNEVNERKEKKVATENKHTPISASFNARNTGCFICNALDHRAATCPFNKQSNGNQTNYGSQSRGRGGHNRWRGRGGHRSGYNNGHRTNYQNNNPQNQSYGQSYNRQNNQQQHQHQQNGQYQNRNQQNNSNHGYQQHQQYDNQNNQSNRRDETENSLVQALNNLSNNAFDGNQYTEYFVLDEGSTLMVTNDMNDFSSFTPYQQSKAIAGVETGMSIGSGSVDVSSEVNGRVLKFQLQRVEYIPTSKCKLLSIIILENKGMKFKKEYAENEIHQYGIMNGHIIIHARRRYGPYLYVTTVKPIRNDQCNISSQEAHQLLGHPSQQRTIQTIKHTTGLELDVINGDESCVPCIKGKSINRTFNHKLIREQRIGHTVHTDVNTMPVRSVNGNKYSIHFGDEASRYKQVYFMKDQTEQSVTKAIERYIQKQINEIGLTPKRIHTDRGSNYMAKRLQEYLWTTYKIVFTYSTAYNHSQNGYAEKMIRDATAATRTILIDSKMPDKMWDEAMHTVIYLSNRTFSRVINKTPYEMYFGHRPDLSHLHPYGCDVYRLIPNHQRNKLKPTSELMKFCGYTNTTVNYRVCDPKFTYVIEDTNLTFLKQDKPNCKIINIPDEESINEEDRSHEDENRLQSNDNNRLAIVQPKFDYLIHSDQVTIPKTYNQLIKNEYKDEFLDAMIAEVLEWYRMNAVTLVERHVNMNVLRGHWIWSVKKDEHGMVERFKARYVVDGSVLEDGKFTPTINSSNMRLMLSHAASNKYHVHVCDVGNAYMNAKNEKEYHMYQIRHFEDPYKPYHVLRIDAAAYGLPDSSYLWFKEITNTLKQCDFHQSRVDQCIYYNHQTKTQILLHTDDILLMSPELRNIEEVKSKLSEKYKMKDKGSIALYLGIEVIYNRTVGAMYMLQSRKIEEIYDRIKHLNIKATKLPLPENTNLNKESEPFKRVFIYQCLIGALNYLAITTRPDISIYVSKLAKYMKSPTVHHVSCALKLASYMYETRFTAMKYCRSEQNGIEVYTDAGSKDQLIENGKCTSGVVVMFNSNLIGWSTKRQSAVTDEICAAELFAVNAGLKFGLQVNNLLTEINLIENSSIKLYCDNQSTVNISHDGFKRGSRHYNICLLYIKDYIDSGRAELGKIATTKNIADVFTKFPTHNILDHFKTKVRIKNISKFSNVNRSLV